MSHRRIAVFGGSFNPPGRHHRAIAEAVAPLVDELVVVPCGPRPDKATVGDIAPVHRAAMCQMAFRGVPKTEVDLFDLEHRTYTPHVELGRRYAERGEVWFAVGSDLLAGGGRERSLIHRTWTGGSAFWRKGRFLVMPREGYPMSSDDLPPHAEVVDVDRTGSSTAIRERMFRRQATSDLVDERIASYMERYGLYRGIVRRSTTIAFDGQAVYPVVSPTAKDPEDILERAGAHLVDDVASAERILVVGGDGTMLDAVRRLWRHRLPFIGVNAGTVGYLMNDRTSVADGLPDRFDCHLLPMLHTEVGTKDGTVDRLAFNDAWVERMSGQTAWLKVAVDDRERIPLLRGDGALVCTPQGSTAYARAMGAAPLPVDADCWTLVGNNVCTPFGWRSAPLAMDAEVDITAVDPVKRPVRAHVDGVDVGPAVRMRVRVSRAAAAELCFVQGRGLPAKLADDVFPV